MGLLIHTQQHLQPYLIARCELDGTNIRYHYMGAAQFEFGTIPASYTRLFTEGWITREVSVKVMGKRIALAVTSRNLLDFTFYQPFLQQIADESLQLREESFFGRAVAKKLGREEFACRVPDTWHDITFDVIFSLCGKAKLEAAMTTFYQQYVGKVLRQ